MKGPPFLIASGLIAAALASPAGAQTYPPPYPAYQPPYAAYPGGAPAAIADQHRYENDRLRNQAEANAAFARQLQTETQLRRLEIEVARQPTLTPAPQARPLYSPEQERSLREGAAARLEQTQSGMKQIDDWLDRPR
ncbi:hypothetical protein QOZ96_000175 [Brevundimonas nasdae]|uniref:hypothetical protein n=1 Tax=Brevundimonas nasdae TaxID=172043 RepID=UPI001912494B|nr:hypothetical protein [Brevundimonas nasdae]MBK6023598.1 hypothetical protein [Brevundimonas nasdae]MDQ0450250.1 hypothetical protein [Brevundimonas nasdae]